MDEELGMEELPSFASDESIKGVQGQVKDVVSKGTCASKNEAHEST